MGDETRAVEVHVLTAGGGVGDGTGEENAAFEAEE